MILVLLRGVITILELLRRINTIFELLRGIITIFACFRGIITILEVVWVDGEGVDSPAACAQRENLRER